MRTRFLLVAVVVLSVFIVWVGLSSAEINPESVAGIWLFDEGDGATAKDSSGNGHDGEIGNAVKWTDGQYGSAALNFPGGPGEGAVVLVPHDESLSLVDWTVTVWIKTAFQNGWVEFVSKSDPVGNTDFRNYVMQIQNNTGLLRPQFTFGAGQWKPVAGTTDLRDGEWHHVAGTYDQNFLRAYVDGKMEGEAVYNLVPDTNELQLVIGSISLVKNFFTGDIDEVGVFNVALSEDDIQMVMKDGLSAVVPAVSPSGGLTTTWGAIKGIK